MYDNFFSQNGFTKFFLDILTIIDNGERRFFEFNTNDLIKALEIIKNAVENGELDTQINDASTHLRSRFEK